MGTSIESEEANTTKCPSCGEPTSLKAKKCSACGAYIRRDWSGFQGRTLWDVLNLLILPFILTVGGFIFNDLAVQRQSQAELQQTKLQNEYLRQETERQNELQRQETELQRERDNNRMQASSLQAYFDAISSLQLEQSLGEETVTPAVLTIARTKTQTIMRELNSRRKGLAVQFLKDANLIVHGLKFGNVSSIDDQDCESHAAGASEDHAVLSLANTNLREIFLANANLQAVELMDSDLRAADLRNTDLTNAVLANTDLRGADLSAANLVGADLTGALLINTQLRGAGLTDATLKCSFLREANLEAADLRFASFRGSSMERANFWVADLQFADFTAAYLRSADFKDAYMDGTILNGADLREALLDYSYLPNAQFNGADLFGADLSNASFLEEQLSFDNDPGSDNYNSDFRARNMEEARMALQSAKLCNTIMPDGTVENRDCESQTTRAHDALPGLQPIEDAHSIVGTYFLEGFWDGYFDEYSGEFVEERCCYNGIVSIQTEEGIDQNVRLQWTIISDDDKQQRAEGVGQITDTGQLYFIFSFGEFKGDGLMSVTPNNELLSRYKYLFNGGFGGEYWTLLEARD